MLGIVEIESISSLFLPAGRQGGQGQSPALSNGVYPISVASNSPQYFYCP
jgi:hypothetical protein